MKPFLHVYGGVSFECFTDVYVILIGDLTGVYYRDEILEAYVHLYACAVGQDVVLVNENACPHRACVVNEDIERERNRTYGLDLMLIQ